MTQEVLKLALEALEDYKYAEARTIIREALAQPEQEPDKYVMDIECTNCGTKQSGILTVNTTPPQRKPLTDEQFNRIPELFVIPPHHVEMVVRAIEAAHGIKGDV